MERVGDELAEGTGVFSLGEKIGGDPVGPGDRKTVEIDPASGRGIPAMEADVVATRLPTGGECELVDVGREMTESVECGRGPMRHHAFARECVPTREWRG